MRTYTTESGVVVGLQNNALHYVDGDIGHVDFPEDLIWDLHKRVPGSVYKLAHTHPPGMYQLSRRDKQTLGTWAFALYPFPARLSTITERRIMGEDTVFVETTYICHLESKSEWLKRKGESPSIERLMKMFPESQKIVGEWESEWMKIILEKSYL